MPISEGLFQGQDQIEQDLQHARGWTIDEQKPDFWDGFGLTPSAKGLGQGVAGTIGVLAKGLEFHEPTTPMEALQESPAAMARFTAEGPQEQAPWKKNVNEALEQSEAIAREHAKDLALDPRTTGTAANLVNGFTRVVGEYSTGAVAGGPLGGAALMGNAEGYARYLDLKDHGVDEDTSKRSGILTGMVSAAGALVPFSLPAKLLAPLSTTGTLLAQAGTGAIVNASMGAASRAGDAAILRAAGYPEMADQSEPWDKLNLASDLLTGAFFGAHAGYLGMKNIKIDPAMLDAAKAVQNRQEFINRAVGVPVDIPSAAIHRQSLETALGDLLSDKPVDLKDVNVDGATFARPAQDPDIAARIIREEFEKSGVLDDAGDFDRWLRGEEAPAAKPKEATVTPETMEPLTAESVAARREDAEARLKEAGPEPTPEERQAMIEAETERLKTPPSVEQRLRDQYGEDMDKVVREQAEAPIKAADEQRATATKDLEKVSEDEEQLQRSQNPAAAALADHPDMEMPVNGENVKAEKALEAAKLESAQANKEADIAFATAADCGARHA